MWELLLYFACSLHDWDESLFYWAYFHPNEPFELIVALGLFPNSWNTYKNFLKLFQSLFETLCR